MGSLVLELQQQAADGSSSVTELVRKARVVATKLQLTDFNDWLQHELHGYPDNAQVPDYREIPCDVRTFNPYNGHHIPVDLGNLARYAERTTVRDSVGSIEKMRDGATKAGIIARQFPQHLVRDLREELARDSPYRDLSWFQPYWRISPSSLDGILDRVRSLTLDWSLQLEQLGIMGEDMSFTDREKEKARSVQSITIGGNFQGVLGNIAHSDVAQQLNQVSANDTNSLRSAIMALGLSEEDFAELLEGIQQDPRPSDHGRFGPRVGDWIAKVLSKAASGAYQIAVGTAANVLTASINQYYNLK